MAFVIVATFRDDTGKMRLVLTEDKCGEVPNRYVIDLPGMNLPLHSEEEASRHLANLGYESDKVIFMGSARSFPNTVISFFLAPNVKDMAGPCDHIHIPEITTINGWLSEQTQRDVIIGTNVWAGLYLRIAYLTGNPVDQIQ